MGDFNLNFESWDPTNVLEKEIEDKIILKGFVQTIQNPTHLTNNGLSIIDLSWLNSRRCNIESLVIPASFADSHFSISTRIRGKVLDLKEGKTMAQE